MVKKSLIFLSLSLIISLIIFTKNSYSQSADIELQDRVIRDEQEFKEEQRRVMEFERIEKERQLKIKEEERKQKTKEKKPEIREKKPPVKEPTREEECVIIKAIELEGSKAMPKVEQKKLTLPFINQCLETQILPKITKDVTSYYRDKGFADVKVIASEKNNGQVKLEIIEGKINVKTSKKNEIVDKAPKSSSATTLDKDKNLNVNETSANIDEIDKSEEADQNQAASKKEEKFSASAKIGYNNLGNKFSGVRRTKFTGSFDNLLSLKDKINLTYNTNLDDPNHERDLKSFSSGISIPFSKNTFFYDYSRTRSRGPSSGGNGILTSFSNRNSLAVERVLLSTTSNRVAVNLGLTAKESGSYLNRVKIATSQRRLTIGDLSLSSSSHFKNGLHLYLKPGYSRGLKLLNANQDRSGLAATAPKAQFELYKFYLSLSKDFTIPNIDLPVNFAVEADSQIARDTLFGSETFTVGSYHSVRGFKENYLDGDHGYYLRNKLNFNLGSALKPVLPKGNKKSKNNSPSSFLTKNIHHLNKISLEPFYDYGYAASKTTSDSGRLSGTGLKTIFASKYFDAALTYSRALQKSSLLSSTIREDNSIIYFELSAKCC